MKLRFKLNPAEIARLEAGDELSRFVHALLNEWDRNGLRNISASATLRNGSPWHLLPSVPADSPIPKAGVVRSASEVAGR